MTDPFPGRAGAPARASAPDVVRIFRAMASENSVRVVAPRPGAGAAVDAAVDIFRRVEGACSRFDPTSALMRANATPQDWHEVPPLLHAALREALRAHEETAGLFDPRVLRVLTQWGYDRSLAFEDGPVSVEGQSAGAMVGATLGTDGPWRPQFAGSSVRIGPEPVDLGGIAKGLAVRWAREQLQDAGGAVLIDAGGDLYAAGTGPEGTGWQIGVEDPRGGAEPLAVLSLTDLGCATSSVRLRHWRVGEQDVHHLIDPRTGAPGGSGLLAVSVVHPDPAWAEVWSKALFLAGEQAVASSAEHQQLAALWVDAAGGVGVSSAMTAYLVWQAPDVG